MIVNRNQWFRLSIRLSVKTVSLPICLLVRLCVCSPDCLTVQSCPAFNFLHTQIANYLMMCLYFEPRSFGQVQGHWKSSVRSILLSWRNTGSTYFAQILLTTWEFVMILIKDHSDKFKVNWKKMQSSCPVLFSHMEKQW